MTMMRTIGGRWIGQGGVTPRSLFNPSRKGLFHDYTAPPKLRQADGVTPLAQPGQALGAILGTGMFGTPAIQPVVAQQPAMARAPKRRRNILSNGGLTGAVAGTPGTGPTGWTEVGNTGTISLVEAGAGRLGGDRLTLTAAATRRTWSIQVAAVVGLTYITTMLINVVSGSLVARDISVGVGGHTTTRKIDGVDATATAPLTPGLHVIEMTTVATSTASVIIRWGIGANNSDVTGEVIFDGIQVELGTAATAYQLTRSANEAIEAGQSGKWFARHDYSDDAVNLTMPWALTGDEVIVTRDGIWVEPGQSWASGATMNVCPARTASTEGVAAALSEIGMTDCAIMAHIAVAGSLTADELAMITRWATARGSKGLLTVGAPVQTWNFSDGVQGWTALNSGVVTSEAGALRVTNATNSGLVARSPDVAVTPGAFYLLAMDVIEQSGNPFAPQASTDTDTLIARWTNITAPGPVRILFRPPTAGCRVRLSNTGNSTGNRLIDNVTISPVTLAP